MHNTQGLPLIVTGKRCGQHSLLACRSPGAVLLELNQSSPMICWRPDTLITNC